MSLLSRALDVLTKKDPPRKTGVAIGDHYGSNLPTYFPDLYTAYKNSADVFRAVDVIAKSVGKKGYIFTDLTGKGDPNQSEVKKFEAFARGPYGTGSVRSVIHKTTQALSIAGNFYWVLTKSQRGKEIVEWNTMLPQYVRLMSDKFGQPISYHQAIPGQEMVAFEPEEIVHVKASADPEFELFGISPLDIIIRTEVIADLAAAISNRKMFENDQIPPIMYIFEDFIADDEIKQIQEKLKQKHSGTNNRHRNLYVKGIKDVKPLSVSAMDAEFTKLRAVATEKVCAAYGVPKSILGYRDSSYGGSATASVMDQRALYELTIEPMERAIEDVINRELLPKLGFNQILFHFNPTNTEDIDKIHEYAREDAKTGLITINEARKKIGLDVADNDFADELLIHTPQGATPLGTIVGQETPADEKAIKQEIEKAQKAADFYEDLDRKIA